MDTQQKLEVLRETCSDNTELDRLLGKLLDLTLGQQQLRLERYERDLRAFETRYGMGSATFYKQFEAGAVINGVTH